MRRGWVLLAFVLLLLLPLTGCLGGDDTASQEASEQGSEAASMPGSSPMDAEAMAEAVTAESVVEAAPVPAVGDWYTWTWTENAWDQVPESWTTAVVSEEASSFLLAPDVPEVAAVNAQWGWVTMGETAKDDLATSLETGVFDYLDFPLEDGKSWTSTWGLREGGVQVAHEATFVPEIDTGNGVLPGYRITATPDESTAPFVYEYVPAVGYLTSIGVQDEDGTWQFRWEVTDWGSGWSGTAYTATSQRLLSHVYEADTSLDDEMPGETGLQPEPQASFQVSPQADSVFVQGGAYAWAGATDVTLTGPDGSEQKLQATSTSPDGDVALMSRFLEPVEGTWEATFAGAGADSAGWIDAWQHTLEEHTL